MLDGFHAKLTIMPFEDSETTQMGPPAGPPFNAQFNPESFTIANEFDYEPQEPKAQGDDGGEAKFKGIKPRTFSFDFLLDGTGAAGMKMEVLLQIELFKQTVGYSGKIHRPHFLVLNWGTFIATCALESFSINYKLFRPDGTPLRAVLSASFREHKSKTLKDLLKNLMSPDVTHAHLVQGNDHLSLITQRVYKDPRYYFQVAEKNGLNNLRRVETGTTLYLYPLKSTYART
jgi:nucleoid-associated protein YgaU